MNLHLNEGDQVPEDLTPIWCETNESYRALTESKPAYRCVRRLIEHILDARYSKGLFPGTSMYSLLISIPQDGKVDYGTTLRVGYDELTQLVEFNLKSDSAVVWKTTCQPSEVIHTFEHLLSENSEWSAAAKRVHLAWLRFDAPLDGHKSLIVPRANPDFGCLIDSVVYWMIEYDTMRYTTIRELGFDEQDNIILAMPLDQNYGYWSDNQLKLSDYERFNPITTSEREFDTAWMKFTSEWKRH